MLDIVLVEGVRELELLWIEAVGDDPACCCRAALWPCGLTATLTLNTAYGLFLFSYF